MPVEERFAFDDVVPFGETHAVRPVVLGDGMELRQVECESARKFVVGDGDLVDGGALRRRVEEPRERRLQALVRRSEVVARSVGPPFGDPSVDVPAHAPGRAIFAGPPGANFASFRGAVHEVVDKGRNPSLADVLVALEIPGAVESQQWGRRLAAACEEIMIERVDARLLEARRVESVPRGIEQTRLLDHVAAIGGPDERRRRRAYRFLPGGLHDVTDGAPNVVEGDVADGAGEVANNLRLRRVAGVETGERAVFLELHVPAEKHHARDPRGVGEMRRPAVDADEKTGAPNTSAVSSTLHLPMRSIASAPSGEATLPTPTSTTVSPRPSLMNATRSRHFSSVQSFTTE